VNVEISTPLHLSYLLLEFVSVCIWVGSLPAHVPQILINREPLRHLNFDVELLGDCDVIINELCHHLGDHFTELCTTASPATEITTDDVISPATSAIHQPDSALVAEGTEIASDDVDVDINIPIATVSTSQPSSSGPTVSAALGPAVAETFVDVVLPMATVSAAVGDVGSSSAADMVVTSPLLSADAHVDADEAPEPAVTSLDNRQSQNAVHDTDESPTTPTVSWASLLKRIY